MTFLSGTQKAQRMAGRLSIRTFRCYVAVPGVELDKAQRALTYGSHPRPVDNPAFSGKYRNFLFVGLPIDFGVMTNLYLSYRAGPRS
jgi:hypothetical protein